MNFKPGHQYAVTFKTLKELKKMKEFIEESFQYKDVEMEDVYILKDHLGKTFDLNFNEAGSLMIPKRFRSEGTLVTDYPLGILKYVKIHKSRKLTKKELKSLEEN